MTYTATSIRCGHAVRAGLQLREPRREIEVRNRRMYVTEAISALLDGGPAGTHFANGQADAQVTNFIAGWSVSISRQKRKWKRNEQPNLVKLAGYDEVWEMCFRKPKPGWRLFGRFLERGVFVGLHLRDKVLLGSDYDEIVGQVIADWEHLFSGMPPIGSADLDDYVGFEWRDIDDEH